MTALRRPLSIALVAFAALAVACGSSAPDPGARGPAGSPPPSPPAGGPNAEVPCEASCEPAPEGPAAPRAPLEVRFLGVAGFELRRGSDVVLTAPLFTRPSMFDTTVGTVASDAALVQKRMPDAALVGVSAIVSGHAHYDHLLDVPNLLARAPKATLFSNRSAKHILAALAPDRAARCSGAGAAKPIARSRVVALDDPASSAVDYRSCPDLRPPGAPLEGRWVDVPGADVRIFAVCTEHPDQLGPVHYAPGGVEEDACALPTRGPDWKEGITLSYLVDFLDPATKKTAFRVYYEDAPAAAPLGQPPAAILAEHRVDLALLCVGASNAIEGAPRPIVDAIRPRYALGGHWEDFFQAESADPPAIPFLDVTAWRARAEAAVGGTPEARPILVDGSSSATRVMLPKPNARFEISAP